MLQISTVGFQTQLSTLLELPILLLKTILFRPYVFVFLVAFLFAATQLIGRERTWRFWLVSWGTAFVCEFSSTRTGIPFGWYQYTASTLGQELYFSNIPCITSISFSFLLYASYCMALCFLLPSSHSPDSSERWNMMLHFDSAARTHWSVLTLTTLFFVFIDMVIDPLALQGNRWFLGKIYDYPNPGTHFGVPLANYIGWAVVGLLSLSIYFRLEKRVPQIVIANKGSIMARLFLGVALYYGVLLFNLSLTFWIGEPLLGMTGLLLFLPVTVLLILRLMNCLPLPHHSPS